MTTCTRRVEFDAAHRLPNHDGKCRRLHGHRYVVDVTFDAPLATEGPKEGMVVDFGIADEFIAKVIDGWDHRTLLHRADPLYQVLADAGMLDDLIGLDFVPTAENIATHIGQQLGLSFPILGSLLTPVEVRVQETPKGWATWRR